jgi:N-acetyl-anhydromuramyl-L-alanine amidase AmpD
MKGETRQYIGKIELDFSDMESIKELSEKLHSWLNAIDAPGTVTEYNPANESDPPPYSSQANPIKQPGTREPAVKPAVERRYTPNQSARNGVPIRRIILHYTTTRSDESTISWFANPASRVSAHYLVSQSGKIYQFVKDSDKAWHAYNNNSDTIGIEHAGAPGDKLTAAQEKASVALLRYLKSEYKIANHSIQGHGFLPEGGTGCPGSLWPTKSALDSWVNKHLA